MRNPARPPATTASMLLSALVVLALATSACSGDDKGGQPSSSTSSPSQRQTTPAVATRATFGALTGRLPKKERPHLKESVTRVVDGWLDAAFVTGQYPRNDFHDAFPGFTTGAKANARHDRKLMSNQDIGRRIDAVEVSRRRLRIDVLSVRRKPVGVTARFALDFATSGRLDKHLEVKGRLFLTRNHSGWRIFGYDVTKGGTR